MLALCETQSLIYPQCWARQTFLIGTFSSLLSSPSFSLCTYTLSTHRTYAEMSLDYSLTSPPGILTPEVFEKLHNASPLAKSEAVTTPTLLLVGKNDRRVPPDQARAWFHALKKNKGRNGEPLVVEALTFEGEGHPITNNVENEWVAFEQGLRFLAEYVDF